MISEEFIWEGAIIYLEDLKSKVEVLVGCNALAVCSVSECVCSEYHWNNGGKWLLECSFIHVDYY